MKRSLVLFAFLALLLGASTLSGLTTWTVPSETYPTLASAVTALNNLTQPVGDSYVIDVAPGYTETLTGRITLTATGTATNTISIKKESAGTNPVLTAYVGTSTGAASADGMFALSGCDYVTIDGIDLYDPNTTGNAAMMEYGYGLFKAGVTDGAQYNTIKNCTVTLNRNNLTSSSGPITEGAACITMPNSVLTAPATALTPTLASGTNSYNKFYANYLTNANYGIAMVGYAASTPFTLGDTGNDVGGTSTATGNQIINFGGGTGATVPSAAIRGNNQWGWNASYNTINNNNGSGVNHPNTLRGIYAQAGTSASCDINYNELSIKGSGTTSQLAAIECAIGSTAASNTTNVNNNTIHDCTYSTATSATMYGIYHTSTPATANFNNNVIYNMTLSGTGPLYPVYFGSPTTVVVNYNTIYNITKTGSNGTINAIRGATALITVSYNEIHDLSVPTSSGISGSQIYGIYNLSSPTYEYYCNNQIYNFSINGSGTSTASVIQGIYSYTSTSATKIMSNNLIYGLQYGASGAASVIGIRHNSGSSTIGQNKIYNLTAIGSASVVSGITIEGGTTNSVQNNMIHTLQAAGSTTSNGSPAARGISITGGTTNNIHYNSVYLTYNGPNAYYSTAGIYLSNGTTNEIRNNIIVNKSTPGTIGRCVAIWKSATGTTYIGPNSNKNVYYYTPGQMAFNGSNIYSTLADWKSALADRDQGSYEEDVPWLSPTRVIDLHIDPNVATRVEGNAVPIVSLCDVDFDNENRNDSTPDIGADEGLFTAYVAAPGEPVYSSPANGVGGVAINAPLVWSASSEGGTPTSYEVYIGETLPTLPTATVTTTSYNPVMQYSKTYSWKIIAINGQGSTEGPVWTFTTMDDPNFYVTSSAPYLMDFEEISVAGSLPQYWSMTTGTKWTSLTSIPAAPTYNRAPRSGTDYLTCYYSPSSGSYWMYSRPMYLDAAKTYDFGIWYNTDGYGGWTNFKMCIGTVASDTGMSTVLASVALPTNMTYAQLSRIGWQPLTTGSYIIGLQVVNTSVPYYMSFDDFTVSETPADPILSYAPSSLSFGQAMQNIPTLWKNVTVSNTGGGTINLTAGNISLVGTDPTQFEFSTANLVPLGPGGSCTIPVRMTATSEGAKSATLRITWGSKAFYDVALDGEGLPAGTVVIGNGTADLTLPIEPYYGYTYSQSIFLQSEIATADKRIEKLSYYWNGAAAATKSNDWVVYMGHTPNTAFTNGGSWIPLSNLTQVFSGEVALPATAGWIDIDLQNYFIYNNSENLVICVDENETSYDTDVEFFFCSSSTTARSIAYRSDGTNPDPATPPTGTIALGYPNIKLLFGDIPQIPVFSINPASKNYGNVLIGNTAEQTFTITNTGGGTLSIAKEDVTITGTDAAQFILTPLTEDISLNAGYSTPITVTFTPTSGGVKTASIQIIDNVAGKVQQAKATELVPLSGNGVDPHWDYDGFENGSGDWTIVNGTQTNQWYWGTATANGGTHSMYVSNDSGATNSYTINATSVTHFYRDIAFPANATDLSLRFDWKGQGEGTAYYYDYLRVYLVDQTVTPVAGTQLTAGQVGGTYNLQAIWQHATIALPNSHAGTIKRVVFSWTNDGSLGAQPPAAVDNIGFYQGDNPLPVELTSFTALVTAENFVNLTWVTQSETGVQGYYIYRSNTTNLANAIVVSPMINSVNSTEQHSYQFTDTDLFEDGTYYYWLENVDFGGNEDFHGPVSVYYSTTGDDPVPEIPLFTELKDIYPNPFNPVAYIPYSIANTTDVFFKIYNSRGQLLRNISLGTKVPGYYRITWDGKDSNGATCGNGVYYIIMQAGKNSFQRKAVLLK